MLTGMAIGAALAFVIAAFTSLLIFESIERNTYERCRKCSIGVDKALLETIHRNSLSSERREGVRM